MIKPITNEAIKEILVKVLSQLSYLDPYLFYVSNHSSVYVKFKNPLIGSLRIADHPAKLKYRYKWNITIGKDTREEVDRGVKRFHYNEKSIRKFKTQIDKYHRSVGEYHEEPLLKVNIISKLSGSQVN